MNSTVTPSGGVEPINTWLQQHKDLTQKDFAQAIKLHPTTVNQMLKRVKMPSDAFFERAAKFTGLDYKSLSEQEEKRSQWLASEEGKAALAQLEIEAAMDQMAVPYIGGQMISKFHEAEVLKFSVLDPYLLNRAGFQLTRGHCRLFRNNAIEEILDTDFDLKPGESVRVESRERIKLPDDIAMEIGGHSYLLEDALVVHTSLQILPPHDDHVYVLIQNLGVKPYPFSFGTPCMEGRLFALPPETTMNPHRT